MLLNLDTHILVFALEGSSGSLRSRERKLLSTAKWTISSIVFWELAKLVQLGRLQLDLDDRQVARTLSKLQVWPIDFEVARESTRLDFKGDPADELIAATSVVHQIPLLTRDRRMRRSKIVPLA